MTQSDKCQIPIDIDNDAMDWADETPECNQEFDSQNSWKIMIIDDEPSVHDVTKLALRNIVFENKPLQFVSGFSGAEARTLLQEHTDTAILLLDVVMEDNEAGLKVAKYVREELGNLHVRIILRTGQPGQAPEEQIVLDYDINDYKEKTELTSRKLFTTIVSSLRSYRDIMIIHANREGLQKIIDASSSIFKLQSMTKFASGVLTQLISILGLHKNSLFCKTSSFAATKNENQFIIRAATGDFETSVENDIDNVLPENILKELQQVLDAKTSMYFGNRFIGYHQSPTGAENLIYLEGLRQLEPTQRDLITVFFNNVSTAFDNLHSNEELTSNQTELLYTLGEMAETRSHEIGYHIHRVVKICKLFAEKLGMNDAAIEELQLSAAMHDIGKLAIEDQILNKPVSLSNQEFDTMKSHSITGYEILSLSNRKLMQTAAIIALQHHEKYDGTGYPNGLKGDEIHIYGRITALADVFDALSTNRAYRNAWEIERVTDFIRAERGKHFDPDLVDIFFENIDEFIAILQSKV